MIVILLAEGFEEIEALTPFDMLKRAGCDVRLVGISAREVKGSHGISVICDATADEILLDDIDIAVFPGGMPGSLNLDASPVTDVIIKSLAEKGGHLAAICAAPLVLGKRGVLEGKRATCYPGFEGMLLGASLSDSPVVTDGNVTTAKGMGVALEFSKELVRIAVSAEKAKELSDSIMEHTSLIIPAVEIAETAAPDEKVSKEPPVKRDFSDYEVPSVELLSPDTGAPEEDVSEEIQNYANKIIETLYSFAVTASIKGVDRGPAVTRYEVVPAKGVKVSKIVNLADDIALCVAAGDIRVEAPIPGKSAIGIEIPNRKRSLVRLRKLLENEEFASSSSKSFVAIGEDVSGEPVYADLAKMPHVIVGGATGMGKSVAISSMLVSMLYKARPDELKLIMIDPKQVEFTYYNGSPHLLTPVISDPKEACGALAWAADEMNRRYDLLRDNMVRNIDCYNEKVGEDPTVGEKLPRIVIVIDELADLMLQVKDPVENLLVALAQKARAAGIHLIIGTQRPSVNVITGVIKANIPTRMCLKVSSVIDSRTVLEVGGAEKLLNSGDMLFSPLGAIKPIRVQGAYVSDHEIADLLEHLKERWGEDYDASVTEKIREYAQKLSKGSDDDGDEEDEVLDGYLNDKQFLAAVEIAVTSNTVSTSMLQRKLSIGYGKAAKFIDVMYDIGIVGEQNGTKPRAVLMTEAEWRRRCKAFLE